MTDEKHVTNLTDDLKPSTHSLVQKLVLELQKTKDHSLIPSINFEKNQVYYPLLQQIGKDENEILFLENLIGSASDVLEKQVYEKIPTCPDHPENLFVSARMYCPKCSSIDIKKLSLVEHKLCGYIDDITKFDAKNITTITKCPHCNNPIRNPERELRLPGMWYSCHHCKEKFDNALLKLHCRKFNHDFDIHAANYVSIPYYTLKSVSGVKLDLFMLVSKLGKVLESNGFHTQEFVKVKGTSGISHPTSLYGHKEDKRIVLFVKASKKMVDDAEINSVFADVLDISPDLTILIGIPDISDRAKAMASSNGISVIIGTDYDKIIDSVNETLSKTLLSDTVEVDN